MRIGFDVVTGTTAAKAEEEKKNEHRRRKAQGNEKRQYDAVVSSILSSSDSATVGECVQKNSLNHKNGNFILIFALYFTRTSLWRFSL